MIPIVALVVLAVVLAFAFNNKEQNSYEPDTKGTKPTYSPDTYKVWADELYQAMQGSGTDEDTIFYVLKQLKNPADWSELVQAFGFKDEPAWYIPFDGGNLVQWLMSELSHSDFNKVRQILSNINVTI